jgi:glycolate oxidase iron-sulfur subunit
MHLVDHARAHIEATYERPFADRAIRAVLAAILPYPNRFRVALTLAALGKPFAPLIRWLPGIGSRLSAMLALAPWFLPGKSPYEAPQSIAPQSEKRGRVAILTGCAQPVLNPDINEAAIRLLTRMGLEVVVPKNQGCCGALVHHMGKDDASHAFAKQMINAWMAEIDGEGLDAIVITASGCGTTIKDYGHMFRNDPEWAEKAAKVSSLAKDVTEVLTRFALPEPTIQTGQTIAYHSACSMQHGQQLRDEPKKLLKAAGFTVKDVPEGHICCGSAGTYNMLQPEISGQLRERKVSNIEKLNPDIIATGNLGCMSQIGKGLADRGKAVPVVHTVELIDWATGGPKPRGIS